MTWLEDQFHNTVGALLPQPRTRRSTFTEAVARSIVVFRQGENPSFSYFLEERLRFYDARIPVNVRCLDHDIADINPEGCFVIICRYLGWRQVKWIERHAAKLAGVGMFIDDDVSAIVLDSDTPLPYRVKLARLHLWPLRRLNAHLDIVWAATPTLVRVLESNGAVVRLLPPLPTGTDVLPAMRTGNDHCLIIGYHATGIHRAEHAFLKPIIDEILSRHENVIFEVTADRRNATIWQNKKSTESRLRILPPLPWKEFALRSRHSPADIALVPLLDGRINSARADTKRIDVSRMGAAAIYSNSEVYSRNQSEGEMLVENNPAAWIAAIQTLLNSKSAREAARSATFKAVERMRAAQPNIPGLLQVESI
ncbi:hypothetical protein GFB56_29285 [Ensifer sp. T173]|uniref:Glycosyl transferases group 1 n=1 Tax=Ensifer canadensis TaxID=555315 RepID=A0AAW4FTW2_9HYPH|nr:hypothetical protein [Ensifer canadensis]MBM3094842.1 hypothetical protein [Ensifer canadensis]UBI79090.1 hypothetical protein J3R84_23595 [Ensifer canadensis]